MAQKKKSFEDSVKRLEDIIETMEGTDVSLETSLKLYKEGIELSAFCMDSLNEAEKQVTILTKELDGKFKRERFETLDE